MTYNGIALACRYAYPPNSLSLCGPPKRAELCWYSSTYTHDKGTEEILHQFSTLYPYLCFIAGENHIADPFDRRVVEAYWIGNDLLQNIKRFDFLRFIDDALRIRLPSAQRHIAYRGLPHHAFHVLHMYKTINPDHIHALDACIIHWGKIVKLAPPHIFVETQPLIMNQQERIEFGPTMIRKLHTQGDRDTLLDHLSIGNWVSYHWGYICEKLMPYQLSNLKTYTYHALSFETI